MSITRLTSKFWFHSTCACSSLCTHASTLLHSSVFAFVLQILSSASESCTDSVGSTATDMAFSVFSVDPHPPS